MMRPISIFHASCDNATLGGIASYSFMDPILSTLDTKGYVVVVMNIPLMICYTKHCKNGMAPFVFCHKCILGGREGRIEQLFRSYATHIQQSIYAFSIETSLYLCVCMYAFVCVVAIGHSLQKNLSMSSVLDFIFVTAYCI